jgi:AraC family transcriptional regulator, regulatory protein of adaptative response / methylated-DNA-[protein]-cysteine methyltransferase
MKTNKVSTSGTVADDPRWVRIVARDKSADGIFWYSVLTTGVYCRPSCPSRIANPKNVQIHSTLAEAKATGFRPCKRCNPDDRSADDETAVLVAKACRLIDNSEEELSLDALATRVGRSSSHFHRLFKATTGLTPKEYADAHRAARIREGLVKNTSVTEAIYDAGFNSSGRFYEKSKELLGMTPPQYRTGGANEEINFALGQTTLGSILVASSKKGVVAILLGDDPDKFLRELQNRFPKAKLISADKEYEKLVAHVVASSKHRTRALTCRSISAALPFSSGFGACCRVSRLERPCHMRKSPRRSDRLSWCEPSPALARQTISRSPFLATVLSAQTVPCRDTHGASIANANSSTGRGNRKRGKLLKR